MTPNLEDLFTGPAFADIAGSPLQRAICRGADARDLAGVLDDAAMQAHFGVTSLRTLGEDPTATNLAEVLPTLVVLVCGVRAGKSFLTACALLRCVFRADLSALKPHEIPRAVIVGPNVDNADATFKLLLGIIENSPALRRMVDGVPSDGAFMLRRPDGRRVEVVVVAAHRGGIALRSRWFVFAALEEVAGFGAESTGAVVNAEEQLRAAETRLVPGGQVWLPSSPFGPAGLLYTLWKEHFGKPGRVLVVHAPTSAMNPSFPVERIEAIRKAAPDVAAREYDAAWLDADSAFFDSAQLEAATRETPLERPPLDGVRYVAAWDAATRGNSWTLITAHAEVGEHPDAPRIIVDLARQWTGSRTAPLSPERVIAEVADICHAYGVSAVHADPWGIDPNRDLAARHRLQLVEHAGDKFDMYRAAQMAFASERIELPPHAVLAQDLRFVRRKALADRVKVDLPRTPDGRHCDFAAAFALAFVEAVASVQTAPPYDPESEALFDALASRAFRMRW